jgi:APA family basic amino acid/polyamine antiporter
MVSPDIRSSPGFARRLGLGDATLLVMGGIVGSGIFINPYVVAREVPSTPLILMAWGFGGLVAFAGALVYAELAALRPEVGGQYAYLREAFHPAVAFVYGWVLLLVVQSGGMAAVAVTFARYFRELTESTASDALIATATLAGLTGVNCLGVASGSRLQGLFMVLKIVAIAGLVTCGFLFVSSPAYVPASAPAPPTGALAFGAALVPVLFAYGGWHTSGFVMGELKRPARDMPRALLLGVFGVVILYVSVNVVCVRALGPAGLAATTTPASAVMRLALGERGAALIALGIAFSTVGFLAQGILTAPRVYYAMAADGLFFRAVGFLHPRTRVPVVAIALQGLVAVVIALAGRYEQILNYVVSVDFIAMGLTASALFVFRRRGEVGSFRAPGHPWTTLFFVLSCWAVVASAVFRHPGDTVIGLGLMAAGLPAYFFWKGRRGKAR